MNSRDFSSPKKIIELHAEKINAIKRKLILERLKAIINVDVTMGAIWDNKSAPDGLQCADGWKLISNYVGNNPCLMFLEGAETIWRFSDGTKLLECLSECPLFEFYVCDEACSYLLCNNHHDFVIGWGSAECWVKSL